MAQFNLITIIKRIVSHPLFLMIIGFIAISAAIIVPMAALQIIMPEKGQTDLQELLINSVAALSCIIVYWLFRRFIERKPCTDLALPGAVKEWGLGIAIGAGAMTITIAVIAALGGYQIIGSNGPEVLTGIAAMAIISGVTEEILLRGIIFRLFEQWLGSIAALIFSAALFGVLHLGNPNASWLAAFAIALEAGVLLGAIYMLTRRLWAAIGLHMAWNATQGGVFGVKVSGTQVDGFLISQSSGSDWISGGAFGAEASLPAIIICTAIGIYILQLAYRKGNFVPMTWAGVKGLPVRHPGSR
jgi:uncharacterized protein